MFPPRRQLSLRGVSSSSSFFFFFFFPSLFIWPWLPCRRLAAAFLPHQVVEQYALEFLASIKALEEKYADLHHEH